MGPIVAAARRIGSTRLLALVLVACAGRSDRSPDARHDGARAASPSSDRSDEADEAFETWPVERLEAELRAHRARLETARTAREARRAAELARALARLRVETRERDLAIAREMLELAAAAADARCDDVMALAALLARERIDLPAAARVASDALRRFENVPGEAACVARARRMRGVLADHASVSRSELGASDASGLPDEAVEALARWTGRHAASSARLVSVRVHASAGGASARLVAELDRVARLDVRREGTDGPIVVDLGAAHVAPEVPATLDVGTGGLAGVDVERIGSTRLRVRLEPAARARWFALPGPFRVVIDVEPARSEPDEAAGPLVVLDPGHGGFDRGARHEGLVEKDLVLDLALRVERHLGRIAPSIRVVLTRRQDVQLSLEERVAHANALEADAFVSIHLNADWEPVRRGGVTTFVLDVSTDEAALRLAARENGTRTSEVGSLERMLAALQQREQAEGSRRLAEHVHRRTLEAGRRLLPSLPDRGVRAAMFYVLVGARMPAVLLEASFLNQPDEHRALATESYRDALARGIALGIVEYFAATRPALRAPP